MCLLFYSRFIFRMDRKINGKTKLFVNLRKAGQNSSEVLFTVYVFGAVDRSYNTLFFL